ncbi:MAG: hypothetical protein LKE31_00730 [Bacilli bacterium]|jgi:hypothetical protein|nr:hypothetical protein [Bacilli bacterium]MCH4277467.1 hypothetical protein [Bacilli bacterium]
MITISVLGLDQYVVGHYSKEHTANLANLYETDEEAVNFYAPNSMVFHNGVEQTSWNTIVIVKAPHRCEAVESKVADYIIKTLSEFTINLEVEFEYFEEGHHYEHVNSSYPRFILESNLVDVEADSGDDSDEDDEEPDPRDRADLDIDDPNQIFLGDAFAGREHELDEKDAHDKASGETKKKS